MSHLKKAILKHGASLVAHYFCWMHKYAKHPEKYPMDVRYGKLRKFANKVSKTLGCEFIVEGQENIPTETCCFIANHLSMADPLPVLYSLDKPTAFLSKTEIKKIPFVKSAILSISGDFIDHNDIKQTLKIMMRMQKDLSEKRFNWLIYPEGTRNLDPILKLIDFHPGTFRPAMKAGVPIVPVVEYGTFRLLRKDMKSKATPIQIKYLKPLTPEEYSGLTSEEVAKIIQTRMQQAISFDLKIKDHQLMSNKKGYRHNAL